MKRKFKIVIRSRFSAAHFLKEHPGKCRNLHGHTYEVEAGIETSSLKENGMVMDFEEFKKNLEEVLAQLDHTNLNEIGYFRERETTAENLSQFIFEELKKKLPARISFVRVYENRDAYAEYTEE